jgi:MoxR-like ATPase
MTALPQPDHAHPDDSAPASRLAVMAVHPPDPAVTPAATGLLDRVGATLRSNVVLGTDVLELVLIGLLARGHILLEDVPGVGKTLLARTLAGSIGGVFHRIQFTPDLLPADITGGSVYDPRSGEFHFRQGPIFANVILADEINRGTPRAQAALLEAMGEAHVSVDGETHALANPFFVIATQNPVEQHGTFPLPEAELDRFSMLLRLGRPDAEQTGEILRRHQHSEPPREVAAVTDLAALSRLQAEVVAVHVADAALDYIAAIVLGTRNHPAVGLPASPRASVALLRASQARARLHDRAHVLPDDVQRVAAAVLGHRLAIATGRPEDVVGEIIATTPIPQLP